MREEVDPTSRVRELVEPLVAANGLELVDVVYTGGALQVFVDRPGGIDLDTLGELTVSVSRLLDDHDPVPGRYTLEVSSPGLERPLRRPEHFRQFVGSTVAVKTHAGVPGERREQGLLEVADEAGIVVNGRRLGYDEIERARTVFEWGPPPKPGRPAGAETTKRAVS